MADDIQTRFGTLEDIVERQGPKGPYCTFTLQCKGFQQIGAAFGAKLTQDLKNLQGKKVRLRGVFDERKLADGRPVKSFKAIWAGLDTPRAA
jgi:hypothetical protein